MKRVRIFPNKRPVGRPKRRTPLVVLTVKVPETYRKRLQREAKAYNINLHRYLQEILKRARPDIPWDW